MPGFVKFYRFSHWYLYHYCKRCRWLYRCCYFYSNRPLQYKKYNHNRYYCKCRYWFIKRFNSSNFKRQYRLYLSTQHWCFSSLWYIYRFSHWYLYHYCKRCRWLYKKPKLFCNRYLYCKKYNCNRHCNKCRPICRCI